MPAVQNMSGVLSPTFPSEGGELRACLRGLGLLCDPWTVAHLAPLVWARILRPKLALKVDYSNNTGLQK